MQPEAYLPPEDIDLSGNSRDAGSQLIYLLEKIQKADGRSHFPKDGLSINSKRAKVPLPHRALQLTARPGDTVSTLAIGNSRDVYRHICEMKGETIQQFQKIGIVIIGYFLHNFAPDEQRDIVSFVKHECPDALVIATDYTLKNLPGNKSVDEVLTYMSSDFEQLQLQNRSREQFVHEHSNFTLREMQMLFSGEYSNTDSAPLKAGRGVVMATNDSSFPRPKGLRTMLREVDARNNKPEYPVDRSRFQRPTEHQYAGGFVGNTIPQTI